MSQTNMRTTSAWRTCTAWLLLLLLFSAISGFGQAVTVQPPATADELRYLSFLLMQMGSVDNHPNAKLTFEGSLARQFELNQQELAVVRAAGQELQVLLQQLRPTVRSIRADGATGRLSMADRTTLGSLNAQKEQKIQLLANRILNQVRPETAARLRLPGRILAERTRQSTAGR